MNININKICIVTTFDKNYIEAGKTLFNSIRRHTDCTGVDFKIITSDEEVLNEFGKENCYFVTQDIKDRYSNVKYSRELPKEKYECSWHRYEIFNMTEYNRVICIDSDCICVQDISYLFNEELNEYDIISVEDHFVSKLLPDLYSQLEINGWDFTGLYERIAAGQVDIQPALLIVNKNVINKIWYNKLLEYANSTDFTYSIDQGILNDFIYQNNLNIKLLPLEWNYQDLYAIRCPELPIGDPIIIHCQESKPFKHERINVDSRIQKYYDQWWNEHTPLKTTQMKICITTTFDSNYKLAGETLFKSIRKYTDVTGIDFKVITDDAQVIAELGAENCHVVTDEIKARYANVKYIDDIPKDKYYSSWYRYEMFNFKGYDRVICIDSDCICIRDISYLFSEELNQYDIISTEDMIVAKMFKKNIPSLEKNHRLDLQGLRRRIELGQTDIQPALIVANRKIVNNEWYNKLLKYANETGHTYSIDEGILNDFIYLDGLNVKILPMEWNYMDTYNAQIPELPILDKPFIVHCQESKPFKKQKSEVNQKIHGWWDKWWEENKSIQSKTLVVIIVWNRFENLKRWINCWNQCSKENTELIVIHNLESDNNKYSQICKEHGITYIPRENIGMDIGAFQDVCRERLERFPNKWANLIWISDDCIPMSKNFVGQFLEKLSDKDIPCYEISNEAKRHIRTTGFLVTKEISKKLIFPRDPIEHREDCYQFEHKSKDALLEQIISMGKNPIMIDNNLKSSPLWDAHNRAFLNLMRKHEEVFSPIKIEPEIVINSFLDDLAVKYKSDKSSRFHNYANKYDKILSPYRESYSSILEIGVAAGQSIKMWTDYFPKAAIHGADINPTSKICESYSNRIKFHLLDQGNEAQLKNLEQFSPFDLIIDDGNHFWREQILTFNTIFPYLKKGGIYICEDTITSYWKEYANHPISAVDYFKSLADDVHLKGARGSVPVNPPPEFPFFEQGWHRREDCFTGLPLFDCIQFMNGFIVIYKR